MNRGALVGELLATWVTQLAAQTSADSSMNFIRLCDGCDRYYLFPLCAGPRLGSKTRGRRAWS